MLLLTVGLESRTWKRVPEPSDMVSNETSSDANSSSNSQLYRKREETDLHSLSDFNAGSIG